MIGLILGSAYDRAIGLFIRYWKIVVASWVIIGGAFVFDPTANQSIFYLSLIAWYPVPAAIACKAISADFKMTSRSVFRLFAIAIIWSATIGFAGTVLAITLPSIVQVNGNGLVVAPRSAPLLTVDVAATMISLWIGTKWSLAPIIAVCESDSIAASFGRSWRLTTSRFWQMLGFNVAAMIVFVVVWFGPLLLTLVVILMLVHPGGAALAAGRFLPAYFVPLLTYSGIATWIAYIKWLQRLELRP